MKCTEGKSHSQNCEFCFSGIFFLVKIQYELSCLYNFYRLHIINVSYTMNDCRMSKHTNGLCIAQPSIVCAGARRLVGTFHACVCVCVCVWASTINIISSCFDLNGCAACKCARIWLSSVYGVECVFVVGCMYCVQIGCSGLEYLNLFRLNGLFFCSKNNILIQNIREMRNRSCFFFEGKMLQSVIKFTGIFVKRQRPWNEILFMYVIYLGNAQRSLHGEELYAVHNIWSPFTVGCQYVIYAPMMKH